MSKEPVDVRIKRSLLNKTSPTTMACTILPFSVELKKDGKKTKIMESKPAESGRLSEDGPWWSDSQRFYGVNADSGDSWRFDEPLPILWAPPNKKGETEDSLRYRRNATTGEVEAFLSGNLKAYVDVGGKSQYKFDCEAADDNNTVRFLITRSGKPYAHLDVNWLDLVNTWLHGSEAVFSGSFKTKFKQQKLVLIFEKGDDSTMEITRRLMWHSDVGHSDHNGSVNLSKKKAPTKVPLPASTKALAKDKGAWKKKFEFSSFGSGYTASYMFDEPKKNVELFKLFASYMDVIYGFCSCATGGPAPEDFTKKRLF